MLYLYDLAFKEHLKKVYDHVYLAERTKLFVKIRNEDGSSGKKDKDDNIKLPLIGLWRTEVMLDTDSRNFSELHKGEIKVLSATPTDPYKKIKAYKLPLTYQLDLIAGSLKDLDNLLTDTMFYLLENPSINILKDSLGFTFNVQLKDLSIATDYASFDSQGDIYNYTLTVGVEEARLLYTTDHSSYVDELVLDLNATFDDI